MKSFKKGIALIAVLAFLITAIVPIGALADSNTSSAAAAVPTVADKVYGTNYQVTARPSTSPNDPYNEDANVYAVGSDGWFGPTTAGDTVPVGLQATATIYAWAGSCLYFGMETGPVVGGKVVMPNESGAWNLLAGGGKKPGELNGTWGESDIQGNSNGKGGQTIWWPAVGAQGIDEEDESSRDAYNVAGSPWLLNDDGEWYAVLRYRAEDLPDASASSTASPTTPNTPATPGPSASASASESASATEPGGQDSRIAGSPRAATEQYYWKAFKVCPVQAQLKLDLDIDPNCAVAGAGSDSAAAVYWSETPGSVSAKASWEYGMVTAIKAKDPASVTDGVIGTTVYDAVVETTPVQFDTTPVPVTDIGASETVNELPEVVYNWQATQASTTGAQAQAGTVEDVAYGAYTGAYPDWTGETWSVPLYYPAGSTTPGGTTLDATGISPAAEPFAIKCAAMNIWPNAAMYDGTTETVPAVPDMDAKAGDPVEVASGNFASADLLVLPKLTIAQISYGDNYTDDKKDVPIAYIGQGIGSPDQVNIEIGVNPPVGTGNYQTPESMMNGRWTVTAPDGKTVSAAQFGMDPAKASAQAVVPSPTLIATHGPGLYTFTFTTGKPLANQALTQQVMVQAQPGALTVGIDPATAYYGDTVQLAALNGSTDATGDWSIDGNTSVTLADLGIDPTQGTQQFTVPEGAPEGTYTLVFSFKHPSGNVVTDSTGTPVTGTVTLTIAKPVAGRLTITAPEGQTQPTEANGATVNAYVVSVPEDAANVEVPMPTIGGVPFNPSSSASTYINPTFGCSRYDADITQPEYSPSATPAWTQGTLTFDAPENLQVGQTFTVTANANGANMWTLADGSEVPTVTYTYVIGNGAPQPSGELTVSAPDPAQVIYSNLQGLDTDAPTANMGFVAPNLSGETNLTPTDLSLKVTAGNAAFDIPGEQAYDADLAPQAVEITGENATAVLTSETGSIEVTVNAPEGITVTGNPVSYEPNLMSVSFDFTWDAPESKTRSGGDATIVEVTAGEHYDIPGKGDGLADTVEGSETSESVTGGQYVVTSSTPDAPTAEELGAVITVKDSQLTFSFTVPEDAVDGAYVYEIGYKLRPNASFSLPVATITLNVTGGSGEPAVKVGDYQIQTDIPGEQAPSTINLEIGQDYGLFAVVAADVSADGEVTWDDAADDAGTWAIADESVVAGEANPYVTGGFTLTGLADGTTTVTYTVAETGQVFSFEVIVGTGTPPAPDRPASIYPAGINDGSGFLGASPAPELTTNPFTYWTQPNAGLFDDGERAGTNESRPTAPVPTQDPDGGMKKHYQVGPTDAAVCGGGTEDLTLNDRLQIWYDPENIYAVPITDDEGNVTGYGPLDECDWSDYVTMEWEYKPSTKDEDDGNPLKIPVGFGFSGVRSPLLTISPLTEAMDGWWVRLAVYPKDTGAENASDLYWTTRWIRLDIEGVNGALDPVVTVTSNPEAVGSVTNVSRGGDAVFTANVTNQPYGSTLAYKWQSLAVPTAANPTPAWTDVAGATGQSMTLPNVTDAMSGVSYRCVVTCTQSGPGGLGTYTTSNYLTLNVTEPDGSVYIPTSDPDGSKLIYKFVGDTLQAQISARTDNGDPVTYQWYVRSYLAPVPESIDTVAEAAAYLAGAGAEPISGATSASLTSEPLKEGVYGFRCRVENATNAAKAAYSPIIYVVVSKGQIEIYPKPGDVVSVGVVNGKALTLTARAKAQNVTYNWQRYNAASQQWTTLTATGQKLTLPALTTQATGTLYRCAISVPGSTTPVYTGWYLVNVWDTANTPVITKTAQNLEMSLSKFETDLGTKLTAFESDPATAMDLLSSSATIAQDLEHGMGPVYAVWYNKDGKIVAATSYDGTGAQAAAVGSAWAANANLYQATISSPSKGSYTSTLGLNLAQISEKKAADECIGDENIARSLNGTYHCVWYKPQTVQEVCEETAFTYAYAGDQNAAPIDMTLDLDLLAPQGTNGTTNIRIEIPGDPWIITDLNDTVTVSVGSRATLSVIAAITQPSDTNAPVYTWQVTENGKDWRNCLSTDGTGQFTSTFTTRAITQDDYDTNAALTYRVIVASRPNVAKIVSNECTLQIAAGSAETPVLTPGPGSPITVDNGIATGITVSKEGTTVASFLDQLNMTVPAGYSLQIRSTDGQLLDADDIVYTGCILQLVNDDTDEIADRATIIVMGDVLGNGIIGINQVVRMAQDLNGSRPLDGIYAQAGDFNESGSIDIADLVHEAQILSEPIDVQK